MNTWQFYDYDPNNDEAFDVCDACWDGEAHQAWVKRDKIDRENAADREAEWAE